MSDKRKFQLINQKMNKQKPYNPPRIKFDGKNDISELESRLTVEQSDYINGKLFALRDVLEIVDGSIGVTKGEMEKAKQIFLAAYEQTFLDYTDMLKHGTEPDRAKFLLMKSLRDTLTKTIILGVKNNEHSNTNETTQKQ